MVQGWGVTREAVLSRSRDSSVSITNKSFQCSVLTPPSAECGSRKTSAGALYAKGPSRTFGPGRATGAKRSNAESGAAGGQVPRFAQDFFLSGFRFWTPALPSVSPLRGKNRTTKSPRHEETRRRSWKTSFCAEGMLRLPSFVSWWFASLSKLPLSAF